MKRGFTLQIVVITPTLTPAVLAKYMVIKAIF